MKPINLRTLQVRIGKCHLNLKSDGVFGVSLQMGKNISSMSPKKNIQSNIVAFNTTLRMNIDKQLLEQQTHPKCRVLLYLIRESREKQVIGVATIDIMNENNKGFKYHEFGQCADCEADIEMSITCSSAFQLGVRSEIGHYYTSESRLYEGNDDHSRVKDSFIEDSMLDGSDYNLLNRSKAVSNVDWTSLNRPLKPAHLTRPRRSSNVKSLRIPKPQNLASCPPQEIITHYETEIKTLEDQIHQKDEWANGMKQMIQQLEAENQLLKQIKIEELQQNNIQNLEQGIEFVSKLVHSKFEASKSMVYDTPISEQQEGQNTQRRQRQEELKLQLKQSIKQSSPESQRFLTQTRSYNGLPQIIISPRIDCSPLKYAPYQGGMVMESREQLENALKILTDGQRTEVATLEAVRIADLQQSLFRVRQERQEIEDMTQVLYEELSKTKLERDSVYQNLKQLQKQLQRTNIYIEQLQEDTQRLKEQVKTYEKSPQNQDLQNIITQSNQLQQKNTELQRKLKESLKAIEEFKNDALNARSEIIVKEDELNSYRMKFGELGSMTDVYLNNLKANSGAETTAEKLIFEKDSQAKHINNSIATASTDSLHSLYTLLHETSIIERKQLHYSLSQIMSEKTFLSSSVDSQINSRNLKKLQLLINKLFIQIFKNNTQFKNLKEIETTKLQLTKQIESIIASI